MYAQRKGGLVFLTKKQWNPSNIRNLEKVYLAEQKAEHERKMAEQLRRENAEKEEMLQLRQASTGKTSTGLEWMYESVLNSVPQVSAEEYLCGKEVKDLDALRNLNGPAGAGTAAAGDAEDAASAVNERDMMAKVLQDPLLLMKKAEQSRIQAALSNPVKMASIAEEKTAELYAEYTARVAARAKPEKIDRAFQRLCHIVKQDKSGHARMKLERLDRALALSVSAALRKKEQQKAEKSDGRSHHSRRHHHRHHHSEHSSAGVKRPKDEGAAAQDDSAAREAKRQRLEYGDRYGLKTSGSDSLAPRLQVKPEVSDSSESDSSHNHGHRHHRHHSRERADSRGLVNDRQKAMEEVRRQRHMTAGERAAALAQMQAAADKRYAQRPESSARDSASDTDAATAAAVGARGPDERPEFLHGVMSAVYGTDASLEDRLQRNAHRLEHPADE